LNVLNRKLDFMCPRGALGAIPKFQNVLFHGDRYALRRFSGAESDLPGEPLSQRALARAIFWVAGGRERQRLRQERLSLSVGRKFAVIGDQAPIFQYENPKF
jgi:hypothetical protein